MMRRLPNHLRRWVGPIFEIAKELIQESIRNTTGSRNINFKRNRSKFELAEIDQIVFRLDEVQHGTAIIKRDARRCLVSIMDDSKYLEEIDLLKMEIQNSTSRLNSLRKVFYCAHFSISNGSQFKNTDIFGALYTLRIQY